MAKVKNYLAITFAVLLALFAIQNLAPVEIDFLFWSFHSRRVVVIIFALFTGFLLGWVLGPHMRFDQERDREA